MGLSSRSSARSRIALGATTRCEDGAVTWSETLAAPTGPGKRGYDRDDWPSVELYTPRGAASSSTSRIRSRIERIPTTLPASTTGQVPEAAVDHHHRRVLDRLVRLDQRARSGERRIGAALPRRSRRHGIPASSRPATSSGSPASTSAVPAPWSKRTSVSQTTRRLSGKPRPGPAAAPSARASSRGRMRGSRRSGGRARQPRRTRRAGSRRPSTSSGPAGRARPTRG